MQPAIQNEQSPDQEPTLIVTPFYWIRVGLRYLWYLFLLILIIILFQGPEKGFRYLGL